MANQDDKSAKFGTSGAPSPQGDAAQAPMGGGIEQVRDLLIGEERRNISSLEDRLSALETMLGGDMDAVVAARLSSALAKLDEGEKRAVSIHLAALMRKDIQNEISQSEPQILQAITPTFGKMIRSGIQAEFEKLIAYINERLNGSASPIKRAQIRLRSMVSGRSEAELFLEAFPQYSLSSVLLVHRPSGMLISSVRRERSEVDGTILPGGRIIGTGEGNEEIIAGMLSTIANFANDAFVDTNAGALKTLDFETGDLILMSQPLYQLAVLVEGPAPIGLESKIAAVFDDLIQRRQTALKSFDGGLAETDSLQIQGDLQRVLDLSAPNPSFGPISPNFDGGGSGSDSGDGDPIEGDAGLGLPGGPHGKTTVPWYRRPTILLTMAIVLSPLLAWGFVSLRQGLRAGKIERAYEAVAANADLAPYPIEFDFIPGSSALHMTGLLADPSQLGELQETLATALPNSIFESNVRTVWEETVSPRFELVNDKVSTNSNAIEFLTEEVSIQMRRVRQVEADLSARLETGLQSMNLPRLADPSAPHFYDNDNVNDLRAFTQEFLANEGALGFIEPTQMPLDDVERLVAGLTMPFDANGDLVESPISFRASEVLKKVVDSDGVGRRINMVAVVRGLEAQEGQDLGELGATAGQSMLRKAQQVLVSSKVPVNVLVPKIMVVPKVDGVNTSPFQSFVGFSFAD